MSGRLEPPSAAWYTELSINRTASHLSITNIALLKLAQLAA